MSITQQPAEDITFVLEGKDGAPDRKLDICTYFKEMYGVTVTKPRLPCIAYGRKGFIPMEVNRLLLSAHASLSRLSLSTVCHPCA